MKMKFFLGIEGVFLFVALLCIQLLPIQGLKIALSISAVVIISLLICFDWFLIKRSSAFEINRIIRSTLASPLILLIPFAMRATPGSTLNLILDLITYSSSVVILSVMSAARLTALSYLFKLNYERIMLYVAVTAVSLYFIIMGLQVTAKYMAFSMEWADFSFEFPPLWQTCRTGFFRMISIFSEETIHLRYHWPLFYALLSPLTLLWTGPLPALWLHTMFYVATAITAGILTYQYTKNKTLSYWLAAAVTLYLPLHLANLYDLHADPMAMPFILLSFKYAAGKRWRAYALTMSLALLCKEFVGLVYIGFGVWLFFRSPKAGVITAIAGAAWFLFVISIGVPFFNSGSAPDVISMNYGNVGGKPGLYGLVHSIATHPGYFFSKLFRPNNIVAMVSMFLPFLFLPLRSWWIIAAGGLIVLKNGLSGVGIELLVHRETLFVPFVIFALVKVLSDKQKSRRYVVSAMSVALVLTFMVQGHGFPSRGFWLEKTKYTITPHDKICHSFFSEIPDDAPVMVSSHLSPPFMARNWYFLFPRFHQSVMPDYIIVDTLEQDDWDWLPLKEQIDSLKVIVNSDTYKLLRNEDGVFLFKRNRLTQ